MSLTLKNSGNDVQQEIFTDGNSSVSIHVIADGQHVTINDDFNKVCINFLIVKYDVFSHMACMTPTNPQVQNVA